jgi:hypothetical protein
MHASAQVSCKTAFVSIAAALADIDTAAPDPLQGASGHMHTEHGGDVVERHVVQESSWRILNPPQIIAHGGCGEHVVRRQGIVPEACRVIDTLFHIVWRPGPLCYYGGDHEARESERPR